MSPESRLAADAACALLLDRIAAIPALLDEVFAAALGITAPLTLMTNHPDKVAALRRANVATDAIRPLERAASSCSAQSQSQLP